MQRISRKEAIQSNLKRYYTGKPCKKGHIAERSTSNLTCLECIKLSKRRYYEDNRSKCLARSRRHYVANKEVYISNSVEYRRNNPDKYRAQNRKDRIKRSSRIKDSTPDWLSDSQLIAMDCEYQKSNLLTWATGKAYHVDHIIPLTGKEDGVHVVSGLNVPWNLKAIPAEDNLSKGCRFTIQ